MTQRNPTHFVRLGSSFASASVPAAALAFSLALGAAACGAVKVPEQARFPKKELLRCGDAGRLPPICQTGRPVDETRRFASLPSDKGAVARGAYESTGPMGAEAATAKRLFDERRFAEAAPLLARVAYGETHEDAGNRQLADYMLGIALYESGDLTGAADLFVAISKAPSHLRFDESLPWIFRLLTGGCVTNELLTSIVRFTPASSVPKRDWVRPQPGIPEAALFVSARARFEDGRKLESVIGFRDLVDDPEWGALARECIGLSTR
ncbi:MAG: hypothetical protein JST00_28640 [Deltaproteobacteria bacterium]|nr:hypothetical protein [Deltaproteobacteria bacterium]